MIAVQPKVFGECVQERVQLEPNMGLFGSIRSGVV
jgi:hypothetical protein